MATEYSYILAGTCWFTPAVPQHLLVRPNLYTKMETLLHYGGLLFIVYTGTRIFLRKLGSCAAMQGFGFQHRCCWLLASWDLISNLEAGGFWQGRVCPRNFCTNTWARMLASWNLVAILAVGLWHLGI